MRRELVLITMILFVVLPALSQSGTNVTNSGAVSLLAGNYGYDPGITVRYATPSFQKARFRVTLAASLNWSEAHKAILRRWATYSSAEAGILYQIWMTPGVRVYGHGGAVIVHTPGLSGRKKAVGEYILAGWEIFVTQRDGYALSYHFAGGLTRVDAFAEKIEGRPRYHHGFTFNTGISLYLRKRH